MKQGIFFKSLVLSAVAIVAFASGTGPKQEKSESFQQIVKKIRTIESYGLEPINNAEKKQIQRIIGLPQNMIKYYGKKRGPKKELVEYVLEMRGRPLVLYKNIKENYYIAGYIFGENGRNLTINEAKNVFNKIMQKQYSTFFKEIKNKAPQFIIKINGKGDKNKTAIIYVDPECPFCKRFEEKLNGLNYLLKHYGKIYVVEFPLYFHKEAAQRSYWIINNVKKAKTAREKIKIIKEGSTKKYKEIVKENKQNKIDYSNELKKLREINVPVNFGTPSITDKKGKNIRGYIIKNILIKKYHLKLNSSQTAK